jgi:hypothetical protein
VSRAGVAEAARAAVTTPNVLDELARCPSASVKMFGAAAGVAYLPNPAEVARRDVVGLSSITQRDVLDALMGLPAGLPVSVDELSERELRLLRRAPDGAVDRDAGRIVRRAVPPMSPRFAVVAARTWREGLAKAGRFAPFCARAMLLSAVPTDLDDARVQASFYGIGICLFTSEGLQMLVNPELHVRHRHSSAHWWFAEELHRQVTPPGTVG